MFSKIIQHLFPSTNFKLFKKTLIGLIRYLGGQGYAARMIEAQAEELLAQPYNYNLVDRGLNHCKDLSAFVLSQLDGITRITLKDTLDKEPPLLPVSFVVDVDGSPLNYEAIRSALGAEGGSILSFYKSVLDEGIHKKLLTEAEASNNLQIILKSICGDHR